MTYSDYKIEQIVSPMYEKVAQKILEQVKDIETKKKVERDIILWWI